jgi:hypothetical protein
MENIFWKWFGWVISAMSLTGILLWLFMPYDDTDPQAGRSGLMVYTDAKTGCQYLRASGGGITPRMQGDGKQVGCK